MYFWKRLLLRRNDGTKIYHPKQNKRSRTRLYWKEAAALPPEEASGVIKGTSKHIVVVKSPVPSVFEEAIFVVSEGFFGKKRKTDALKEARQLADAYLHESLMHRRRFFSRKAPVWLIAIIILTVAAGILLPVMF